MDCLLSELDPRGVLTLTLNRPEVHNAFDDGLVAELTKVLAAAGQDAAVRIVVLTGTGPSFSAGADMRWMRRMVDADEAENERDALRMAGMLRTLNYLDRPTIARINGSAYGGGLGLLACCDITIAADHAQFGLSEARLGLAPAVISSYVFRRIGEHHARRYYQTGECFDAARARELDLVQDVVAADDLDEAVSESVNHLLSSGPQALLTCKRLAFAIAGHDEEKQLRLDEYTAKLIARLRVSAEGQEGLNAFLEKRPPGWTAP
ncbi:MAG: enoyl-CoA hydratase/isomerase family protein [Xanthomonadales bacterium]|nr:enoyl-CoA hydratase/isomerase family protein [Xanthomonadales bacterium]NIX12678.1 enoyl-CoA hydratase/isomerase family protein [Xanthomonadales bacterium]